MKPLRSSPLPAVAASTAPAAPTAGASAPPAARPPIDTRQIFRPGEAAIEIVHQGTRYTLRLTRANKLILTK